MIYFTRNTILCIEKIRNGFGMALIVGQFIKDSVSPSNKTNVFKTFQNGWNLVEMLSFLLVVFRFFLIM